jgi:hypothetical protein
VLLKADDTCFDSSVTPQSGAVTHSLHDWPRPSLPPCPLNIATEQRGETVRVRQCQNLDGRDYEDLEDATGRPWGIDGGLSFGRPIWIAGGLHIRTFPRWNVNRYQAGIYHLRTLREINAYKGLEYWRLILLDVSRQEI